jgi:osmotically-inducible protein OsmY
VRQRTDETEPNFYSWFIDWEMLSESPIGGGAFTINILWSFIMQIKTTLVAAMMAVALLTTAGCAVTRGQETVGAYVDDSGITTLIKARMAESKLVSATSISVETLNGVVMLSGFAKSATEKSAAENIARGVNNVKSVKNEIAVRP